MGRAIDYSTADVVDDYLFFQAEMIRAQRHYDQADQSKDFAGRAANAALQRLLRHKPTDALSALVVLSTMIEELRDGGEIRVQPLIGIHALIAQSLRDDLEADWADRATGDRRSLAEPFLAKPRRRMAGRPPVPGLTARRTPTGVSFHG